VSKDPIYVTEFKEAIIRGRAFSASRRFTVASGDEYNVLFVNPVGSARIIHVVAIEVDTQQELDIDIYRDSIAISYGTYVEPMNLNLLSSEKSVAKPYYGGSYTGGKLAHQTYAHGGTKTRAIGSLAEIGEQVIIPDGRSIRVKLINNSTSDSRASLRFLWFENDKYREYTPPELPKHAIGIEAIEEPA